MTENDKAIEAAYNAGYKAAQKAIRTATANYIETEGCGCCQGSSHEEHRNILGKLLGVKRYSDGSGYDFSKYKSIE